MAILMLSLYTDVQLSLGYLKFIIASSEPYDGRPGKPKRLKEFIWAVMEDIRLMGPPLPIAPVAPQADDRERVLDRRIIYDEPTMSRAIARTNPDIQQILREHGEALRKDLPAVPRFTKKS